MKFSWCASIIVFDAFRSHFKRVNLPIMQMTISHHLTILPRFPIHIATHTHRRTENKRQAEPKAVQKGTNECNYCVLIGEPRSIGMSWVESLWHKRLCSENLLQLRFDIVCWTEIEPSVINLLLFFAKFI